MLEVKNDKSNGNFKRPSPFRLSFYYNFIITGKEGKVNEPGKAESCPRLWQKMREIKNPEGRKYPIPGAAAFSHPGLYYGEKKEDNPSCYPVIFRESRREADFLSRSRSAVSAVPFRFRSAAAHWSSASSPCPDR